MRGQLAWARVRGLALALGLGLALIACGDDDDGAAIGVQSCAAFTACGGDVVGSWTFTSICVDGLEDVFKDIADQPGCGDFFVGARTSANGEFTFDPDGMLTVEASSFTFQLDVKVTPACVKGLGGDNATLDSARCSMLQDNLMNGDSEAIQAATCSFSGGNCGCKVTSLPMAIAGSGPYEVQGTNLIQGGDTNPYCVEGDRLTIRTSSSAMNNGTMTFQRK